MTDDRPRDDIDRLVLAIRDELRVDGAKKYRLLLDVVDNWFSNVRSEIPTCNQCGMPLEGPLACHGRCEE